MLLTITVKNDSALTRDVFRTTLRLIDVSNSPGSVEDVTCCWIDVSERPHCDSAITVLGGLLEAHYGFATMFCLDPLEGAVIAFILGSWCFEKHADEAFDLVLKGWCSSVTVLFHRIESFE